MYQKSLIIFKPDAIQRRLIGELLTRFERVGLKVHALRFQYVSREQSQKHYAEHVGKGFYPLLEDYITSGPVVVMVLGGTQAIAKIRLMVGETVPADATPGSIRGDYAHQAKNGSSENEKPKALCNLVHASANASDAETEIKIWFKNNEISEYSLPDDFIHGI